MFYVLLHLHSGHELFEGTMLQLHFSCVETITIFVKFRRSSHKSVVHRGNPVHACMIFGFLFFREDICYGCIISCLWLR